MNKITFETFKKLASEIHNNKYQYIEYNGMLKKCPIICPIHGIFNQLPSHHIHRKHGCSKCKADKTSIRCAKSQEQFISEAKIVHDNKYDYSLVNYINSHTKINIICRDHGIFSQLPTNHLDKKRGCPKCKGGVSITQEQFINRANKVHNNFYNYSKVSYKNSSSKIIIICPSHGEFKQQPNNHLSGNGCPKCNANQSKAGIRWLKSLNIDLIFEHIIKIDNRKFKVDGFDPKTNTIYEFYGKFWHGCPNEYNPNDLNKKAGKTFRELYKDTIQRENILKEAGYNIIAKWEE